MSEKDNKQLLRVLFLTRKWPPAIGGMETYSRELVTNLAPLVNLTVHNLPGRSDGRPPSLLKLTNFMLSTIFFLLRYRYDYDVVHFGDLVLFPLAWWHALWAPKASRVISVHGLDLIYGNRNGFKPTLYRGFIAWARKRHGVINYFIANSQNTASLCKNAGFSPVTDIPLGVRIKTNSDSALIESSEKERFILFVGRLVQRKGASWFAENILPQIPLDVKYYVVGKSWDPEENLALQCNSRIRILGYLSDEQLNIVRRNASVIIMPNIRSNDASDVEGFGIAALEAAASGVPLIASNIEGLTDAVRHGETGFLVRAGDAKAWLSQIKQILAWDIRRRHLFRKRAQEALKRYFSWARVAENTVRTYKKSLTKKRRHIDKRNGI